MRTLLPLVTALTLAAAGCGDRLNDAPPVPVPAVGPPQAVDAHESEGTAQNAIAPRPRSGSRTHPPAAEPSSGLAGSFPQARTANDLGV